MSLQGKRFAGMRLAAAPVQDVSAQLKDSLAKLSEASRQRKQDRFQDDSINRSYPVKGTNSSVNINANASNIDTFIDADDKVFGNPEQVELIGEFGNGRVYNLAWSVDGSYGGDSGLSTKQRMRIAREADRRFSEQLTKLPNGSIVTNSPVGADQGDYARADLYLRKGFGPLQQDGSQYGIIDNGEIIPLSPFVPDADHSRHLAARAKAAGETELASAISQELERRGNSPSDFRTSKSRNYDYNDDYYDDYEDYTPPPLTPDAFNSDLERAFETPADYRGNSDDQYAAGIGIRNRAGRAINEALTNADPALTREMVGDGVRRLREQQVLQLQQNYNPDATRNADLLVQEAPRQLPQPISAIDPNEASYSTRMYRRDLDNLPANIALADRRNEFAARLRDRMNNSPTGWDSDPGNIRTQAKQNLTEIYTDPATGETIAQQLYDPRDIELFRQFQENQARNWPLNTPGGRQAPPILDTQGRPMGPAQSDRHPDAVYDRDQRPSGAGNYRGERTNAEVREFEERERRPYLFDERRPVQWRANMPAENLNELEMMRSVDLDPNHVRATLIMSNDRVERELRDGTLNQNQVVAPEPRFDRIASDMQLLEQFTRNRIPFNTDIAQAITDLRAVQDSNPVLLRQQVPSYTDYNIGDAGPVVYRNNDQPYGVRPAASVEEPVRGRPQRPSISPDAQLANERRRRRANDRPATWEDSIAPTPTVSTTVARANDDPTPAPPGMSLDEFLDWRDGASAVSRFDNVNPAAVARPNRIRRRQEQSPPARWFDAPLLPDTEDMPF